jgi:lipopolysaccharide biosynthesis glycosyltransferase
MSVSIEKPLILNKGAWHGHIAFSQWIIQVLAPKVFVELGTHYGDSYFSFCQAVKNGKLATKCFAVDTWKGEEHAGLYDEEVFTTVSAHNTIHYCSFSKLMRSSFDDASSHFKKGSIDLLHIDGYHTYEAVRHDFETWVSKLSQNAVVLFHDTTEVQKDFGVWKFWEELEEKYKGFTFHFHHSHGLGVLGIGKDYSDQLRNLFQTSHDKQNQIREYFEKVSHFFSLPFESEIKSQEKNRFKLYIDTGNGYSETQVELNDKMPKSGSAKFFLGKYKNPVKLRLDLGYSPVLIQMDDINLEQVSGENIPVRDFTGNFSECITVPVKNRISDESYLLLYCHETPRIEITLTTASINALRFDFQIMGFESIVNYPLAVELRTKIKNKEEILLIKQQEIGNLTKELNGIKSDNAIKNESLGKLLTSRETEVREMQYKIDTLKNDITSFLNTKAEMTQRHSLELSERSARIDSLEKDKIVLSDRLKSVDSDKDRLTKQIATLEAEIVKLTSSLTQSSTSIKQLNLQRIQLDRIQDSYHNDSINRYLRTYKCLAFLRGIKRVIGFIIHPRDSIWYLKEKKRISQSGLFDKAFYRQQFPDNKEIIVNPIRHFILKGWRENISPNPLFDISFYLNSYPDIKRAKVNPFTHFISKGWKEGRSPNPLFDIQYYLQTYPDVKKAGVNPLYHFISRGWHEKRNPHYFFDTRYYLESNSDVRDAKINPLAHFLRFGCLEKRCPLDPKGDNTGKAAVFNEFALERFRECYEPILKSSNEKRPGSYIEMYDSPESVESYRVISSAAEVIFKKHFDDVSTYMKMRQDIESSGLWDENWYLSRYIDGFKQSAFFGYQNSVLDYYICEGWKEGHLPSLRFQINTIKANSINPLTHFLRQLRFEGYQFAKNVWFPKREQIEFYQINKKKRDSKGVVYTCILNHYDTLIQPLYIQNDWDYICFTDDDSIIGSIQGIWEIRPLAYQGDDLDRTNRWHKTHPHVLFKEYYQSIYLDGNINFLTDYLFREIEISHKCILLPQHFKRDCVYEEIKALFSSPRISQDNKELIKIQYQTLLDNGFPDNYGLAENNVIFRRHNEMKIIAIMEEWWSEISQYSSRDQVSFAYILWKNGIEIKNYLFTNTRTNYRDFWIVEHHVNRAVPNALKPAFGSQNIAVIFSTNDVFTKYLGVAIQSLILNASDMYNYDVIILERDLTDNSKTLLEELGHGKANISIRFFNMNELLESIPESVLHVDGYVPPETYNKFFLQQILSGYDKCLYLDSDIIINSDVAELYFFELCNRSIGASKNVANIHAAVNKTIIKGVSFDMYLKETLKLNDPQDYFQAGILIVNLKKINSIDLRKICFDKLEEIGKPVFFDQCVFNSVFNGDVAFFSTAWNHVWYLQDYSRLKKTLAPAVYFDYAKGRITPKIVHYAGKDKPQNKWGWKMDEYFWKFAKTTPFFKEICDDCAGKISENDYIALTEFLRTGLFRKPKILFHLHLFYPDQLEFFITRMKYLQVYDVICFITVTELNPELDSEIKTVFPNTKILKVPNAGYDIFPFIKVLNEVNLVDFDYIIKLHTKNAREPGKDRVYSIDVPGYSWRNELVNAIMGSEVILRDNIAMLEKRKDIGCIGARKFIFDIRENNEETVYSLKEWKEKIGISSGNRYIGGSMFIARAYPFERLKMGGFVEDDFKSNEQRTKDYKNLAHVIERLLGIVIENENFTIMGRES